MLSIPLRVGGRDHWIWAKWQPKATFHFLCRYVQTLTISTERIGHELNMDY